MNTHRNVWVPIFQKHNGCIFSMRRFNGNNPESACDVRLPEVVITLIKELLQLERSYAGTTTELPACTYLAVSLGVLACPGGRNNSSIDGLDTASDCVHSYTHACFTKHLKKCKRYLNHIGITSLQPFLDLPGLPQLRSNLHRGRTHACETRRNLRQVPSQSRSSSLTDSH